MSEDLEIIEINTFQELAKLKDAFEKTNKLGIDIRKLTDKNERRRVMDFVTGVAFGRNLKIKSINKDGVFLVYDNFEEIDD